jgi:hypothetical protein
MRELGPAWPEETDDSLWLESDPPIPRLLRRAAFLALRFLAIASALTPPNGRKGTLCLREGDGG